MDRYLLGDKMSPARVTDINRPLGGRGDARAQIWPFKIHDAKQPYDQVNDYLLPVVTAGAGGYWHDFDWNKALALGSSLAGLPYSGKYGFSDTRMYWPLAHGVAPKEQALSCNECHGVKSRLNWQALGYDADPLRQGGRP